MKQIVLSNIPLKESLALVFALIFSLFSFSQLEKGSQRIKINAEIDGRIVEIDTIIPAGVDFDHEAFMKSHGLEGEMDFSEDGVSIEIDGDRERPMRKQVRIEEEDNNGEKTMTKTVIYMDGDSSEEMEDVEVIKTVNEDGIEDVKILIDGKEVEGQKKVIRKQKRGEKDYEIEIEQEIKSEDGQNVIIIEKEVEKEKKKMKKKKK